MTIPQPVIDRLRKLMAMAERGTEHEAALAGERMQAVMQEYNLTRADIGQEDGPEDPTKVRREEKKHDRSALYVYQQDLMKTVGKNNFCIYVLGSRRVFDKDGRFIDHSDPERRRYKRSKCHVLVGRSENVTAAILMYDYLIDAMERVMPYVGMKRRSSDARLWLLGCTHRVCERLVAQRTGAEVSRGVEADGTPGLVRLADLYGSEEDLNNDFKRGWEPGKTARLRREDARVKAEEMRLKKAGHCWEEAWYLARGQEVPSNVPQRMERETPEQEQARREAQAKRNNQYTSRSTGRSRDWTDKDQRNWDRKNSPAYKSGQRAGENIGLGGALKSGVKGELK